MDALSGINTVTLDDLEAPDPSEPLRILRAVFTDPRPCGRRSIGPS
jgi:hypothetical protein